jgi:molecular chaperone HscB
MEWREALDDAGNAPAVQSLFDDVQADRKARIARVTQLLDGGNEQPANPTQAAQEVRALMFIDRLLEEIDARLERYEDAC